MVREQDRAEHFVGQKEVAQGTPGCGGRRGRGSRLRAAARRARGSCCAAAAGPESVKAMALRPLRVGRTQSNRSMPRRMALKQILRRADAHQVPRLVGGHRGADYVENCVHLAGRFADAEPADGVAGKIEIGQLAGTPDAQFRVEAALHDGKLGLIAARRCGFAASRPSESCGRRRREWRRRRPAAR